MHLFHWLYVGAVVILLFGASIFVHEFGHFWVARRRGLKVNGFSIGFGPKLFGWRRGGVDYAWRLIPAGGFVALPQMVSSTALEGKTEGAEQLPPVSAGSKMLVACAGPVMNVLFAFLVATVIYFVGLPVPVDPPIIGDVAPGSAEARLGLRPGDRIVSVNGKPVSRWEDAQDIAITAPTNVLPVTIERDGARTTYSLATKVNPELDLKLLNLEPRDHPTVESVGPGTAAEVAGLKPGDEILAFAGVPVVGHQHLVDLVQKRADRPSVISVRREADLVQKRADRASVIGVRREARTLDLSITPRFDPKGKLFLLGVKSTSQPTVYELQRPGPPPWELIRTVCRQTYITLAALVHAKQTGVHLGGLSGPAGIMAGLAINVQTDLRLALRFMVLLNMGLAFINLLPVPVLDGGHILLAAIEKLRGRPLSPRLQESTTTAFAALLIFFVLYVSYHDIVGRGRLLRSLLSQPSRVEPASGPTNAPAAR
jgi:regulator of sigma E protease